MEAKLKHLEFIQAAISRMATNSFLFKGWAITIAAALSAFGAVETKAALLTIALVSTTMFWALDGYYLWLERGFVNLHKQVAATSEADIDFCMKIDKSTCGASLVQDVPASAPLSVLRHDRSHRCDRHLTDKEH